MYINLVEMLHWCFQKKIGQHDKRTGRLAKNALNIDKFEGDTIILIGKAPMAMIWGKMSGNS